MDLYDEFGNYIGPELSGSEQVMGGNKSQPASHAAASHCGGQDVP